MVTTTGKNEVPVQSPATSVQNDGADVPVEVKASTSLEKKPRAKSKRGANQGKKRKAADAGTEVPKAKKPKKQAKAKSKKKPKMKTSDTKAESGTKKDTKKSGDKQKLVTKNNAKPKPKKGTAPRKKKPLPSRRSIIRAPRSTWINFLTTKRNENLPEHANLSFGQLCKKLSPIWRDMTDEEKEPYTKQYEKDRARFVQEVKLLTKEQKRVLRAHRRIRKKKKQGKPRTPLSAYMFFVSAERENVIKMVTQDFKEVGRELGRRWRSLTPEQRQPYLQKAIDDRQRYENEVEAFNKVKLQAKASSSQSPDKVEGTATPAATLA